MSYNPTEWKTGDIVTAQKLNKIEDGIVLSDKPDLYFDYSNDDEYIYFKSNFSDSNYYIATEIGRNIAIDEMKAYFVFYFCIPLNFPLNKNKKVAVMVSNDTSDIDINNVITWRDDWHLNNPAYKYVLNINMTNYNNMHRYVRLAIVTYNEENEIDEIYYTNTYDLYREDNEITITVIPYNNPNNCITECYITKMEAYNHFAVHSGQIGGLSTPTKIYDCFNELKSSTDKEHIYCKVPISEIDNLSYYAIAAKLGSEWIFSNPVYVNIYNELPSVSASDNGDVLTVVEGAWAKASPTTLVIPVEYNNETDYLTSSKTFKEIQDAISAECVCYFCEHNQDQTQHTETLYLILAANYVNNEYIVETLTVNVLTHTPLVLTFIADNENGYPYVEE